MDSVWDLIQAISAAPDDTIRARLVRDGGRTLLRDLVGIAEVAALALEPEDGNRSQAASALLATALDEARMNAENDAPEGAVLLDALASAFTAQDAEAPFMPSQRLRLAQIYARAGLVPPPFAKLSAETMAAQDAGPDDARMPDIADLLDPLLAEMADEPLQVHAALTELFAGIPSDLAGILIALTVARPGAVEARLGLYWLLDPDSDLRLAAATALASRIGAGPLPGTSAALLPAIRKWLPAGSARAALDGAIKQQMRHGLARATTSPRIHRAACSLPDGAGALSLVATVQSGGRRGVAMAMLKQGHGVKDAFVIPCASAAEQKRMLASVLDEIETVDLPAESWARMLACGLGEGLAVRQMPAPGILDLAEFLGPDSLSPVRAGAADILGSLGADEVLGALPASRRTALVKSSADWPLHFQQIDSWFEDTSALRDAIGRARTETGRETAVWKQLGSRRDWWARQFAISAAVLKSADGTDHDQWQSFAAVAQALLDGTSPKRLPVMAGIVAATLEACADREGGIAMRSRAGVATDVGATLAGAGITEPYLDGYLTALSITPLDPDARVWLGALLGGIEFAGEGLLDLVMEFVVTQANLLDGRTGDPEATARVLKSLDAEGLIYWATGFDSLVAATQDCWPARRLSADDKRVLRAIREIAAGTGGADIRPILPA